MKHNPRYFSLMLFVFVLTGIACAQQPAPPAEPEVARAAARDPGGIGPGIHVPRLIKFSGAFLDQAGKAMTGVHGLTVAVYKDQQGGAPLWIETQNADFDAQGRYTILLGATKSGGVPLELFTSDEPRWLGIQMQLPGWQEEPRVLLVSVPYALKAAEAETLAGLPLSSFVLTPEAAKKAGREGSERGLAAGTTLPVAAVSGTGTANKLPKWLDAIGTLGDSTVTDTGSGVGVGTPSPSAPLHVRVTGPSDPILRLEGTNPTDSLSMKVTHPGAVVGFALAGGAGAFVSTAGADDAIIFGQAGKNLLLSLGGTEGMRLTAAGNVGVVNKLGIGFNAPTAPIHILTNGNTDPALFVQGVNETDSLSFKITHPNAVVGFALAGGGGAFVPTSAQHDAILFGQAGRNLLLSLGGTEHMRVASSGNVGIGTNTPAQKLDVAGNVNASGNLTASGSVTATSLSGSGAGLTSLSASNLSTGTVANARTTGTTASAANTLVLRDGSGNFTAGTITATAFVGGGALITGVNAASLNGIAATNYARTDVPNNLTGTQAITGPVSVRSSSTVEQLNMDTSGNLVALGSLYVGQGNFVTPTGTDVVLGQVTNGSTISNVFRVDSTGKGYFNGGTQTGGADFAESFEVAGSRSGYEPGDVLVIDPSGRRRMALSTSAYSTRVSGIHSTKPGVLATPYAIDNSSNIANEVPLAVIGVVPCKVSAENGAIAVGDLLVTSSTPGHAMRGSNRKKMLGAVVGKALEPLASGKGVIQVLVTLQ